MKAGSHPLTLTRQEFEPAVIILVRAHEKAPRGSRRTHLPKDWPNLILKRINAAAIAALGATDLFEVTQPIDDSRLNDVRRQLCGLTVDPAVPWSTQLEFDVEFRLQSAEPEQKVYAKI